MLRLASFTLIFFISFQANAFEITCEDQIGSESAFIIDGEVSIDKNQDISKTVYSISKDGVITVLESTEGKAQEQEAINQLKWVKKGSGYLGTGFVEIDGNSGTGSVYMDETIQTATMILEVDGVIVSGVTSYRCRKSG